MSAPFRDWQSRVTPLSEAGLNAKIAARIAFFEKELGKRGLHIVCGAEQEFVVLDKDGHFISQELPLRPLGEQLHGAGISLLEKVYPEDKAARHYEVALGAGAQSPLPDHPSQALASEIEKVRALLPKLLKEEGTVLFSPSLPSPLATTAGLHTNFSLTDKDGNNLFCDPGSGKFSTLAEHCADALVELQKQGQPLYMTDKASYRRLANIAAPSFFDVMKGRGVYSVALKKASQPNPGEQEEQYLASSSCAVSKDTHHIEDRLAGANANPYLVMLAGTGALYHAVAQLSDGNNGTFQASKVEPFSKRRPLSEIPQHPEKPMNTFKKSDLWREIAGPELYREIVRYLAAQQRAADTGESATL